MPWNLNEIVWSWMRLPVKTIDIRQCCTLFPRPHPTDTKFKLKPRNNCRCGDRSLRLAFKPAENTYRLSIKALQIVETQCFKRRHPAFLQLQILHLEFSKVTWLLGDEMQVISFLSPFPSFSYHAAITGWLIMLCTVQNTLAIAAQQHYFCSAQTVTRIGLPEEIPRSGVQIPCLS